MSADSYIQCSNISVCFDGVKAVDDVSVRINAGEIVAVVGKNGSGKTTLLQVLEGISSPSEGAITCQLGGRDIPHNEFRKKIGVQLQRTSHFKQLKVIEILKLYSKISKKTLDRTKLYECVDLCDIEAKEVRMLSGGELQKVNIALAVLKDGMFTFYDEPTVGLDVGTREKYIEYLRRSRALNKAAVVITHYIDEVEAICDRVLIMDRGRKVGFMSPAELKRKYLKGQTVRISVGSAWVGSVMRLVEGIECVHWLSDSCLYISTDHADAVISAVYRDETVSEVVNDIVIRQSSLQDAIVRVTG